MEAVSDMSFEPSSNLAKTLPSALEPGGPVWQAEADGEAHTGGLQGEWSESVLRRPVLWHMGSLVLYWAKSHSGSHSLSKLAFSAVSVL